MGHMQQLIQKMQDRMERNIRSHMAEGATYAEASAIVKSRSVAGPAVWRNLDSIFAQDERERGQLSIRLAALAEPQEVAA